MWRGWVDERRRDGCERVDETGVEGSMRMRLTDKRKAKRGIASPFLDPSSNHPLRLASLKSNLRENEDTAACG